MTFTVMARCRHTGQMGMCTTSFSPIAGSRVPALSSTGGILVVMSFAAPALVMYGRRLLDEGIAAADLLAAMRANDYYPEYRQIGIIDSAGRTVANTGTAAVPYAGHRMGDQFIVLGNVVASKAVVDAMYEAYEATGDAPLGDRLLRGIEAGRDAGGQLDGQRSAFIKVAGPLQETLLLDLRVDFDKEPVGTLRIAYERAMVLDARPAAPMSQIP